MMTDDFLIPGLLDTGVRLNSAWEDLRDLTFRALQGGVTALFVEEGIYHSSQVLSTDLFSDVLYVKTVQDPSEIHELPASHAFKIYISDPSAMVSSVQHLEETCRKVCEFGGVLMVDCNMPYRMLLNSPLRYEPIENRSTVTCSFSDEIVTGFDSIDYQSDDEESGDMVTSESMTAEVSEIFYNIQRRKKNYESYVSASKDAYLFDKSQVPNVSTEVKQPSAILIQNSKRKMNLRINTGKTYQKSTYTSFLLNYPENYEINGIKYLFQMMELPVKIHISSLSSAEAVYLSLIRKERHDLTIETSLPYLAFNSEHIHPADTRFKLNPPVRPEANRNDLWKFIKLDSIDVISSKHEYVPLPYKSQDSQEFQRALSGFPTLGHSLSLVWTAFLELNPHATQQEKDREFVRIVKKMSEAIASRFDLADYGHIQPGNFANLVVFSRDEVKLEPLYEDHVCPCEDAPLTGVVKQVYLRGNLARSKDESFMFGRMI